MNIIIKETNAVETLSIIDPNSGVDYIYDLVAGQIDWCEDREAYICDRETFDWWDAVVTANQSLDDRICDLVKEHGTDAVYKAIHAAGSVELGDHAANVNQSLDEAFGTAI